MLKNSKVLAPNLKECHLWVYKGSIRPNHVMKLVNYIPSRLSRNYRHHAITTTSIASLAILGSCRDVVLKHLLALRWMNPGAMVYLRESTEEGQAHVEYELWNGRKSGFVVDNEVTPDDVVAQLMFESRDPALDPEYYQTGWAAEGLKAAGVEPPKFVVNDDSMDSSAGDTADIAVEAR